MQEWEEGGRRREEEGGGSTLGSSSSETEGIIPLWRVPFPAAAAPTGAFSVRAAAEQPPTLPPSKVGAPYWRLNHSSVAVAVGLGMGLGGGGG